MRTSESSNKIVARKWWDGVFALYDAKQVVEWK